MESSVISKGMDKMPAGIRRGFGASSFKDRASSFSAGRGALSDKERRSKGGVTPRPSFEKHVAAEVFAEYLNNKEEGWVDHQAPRRWVHRLPGMIENAGKVSNYVANLATGAAAGLGSGLIKSGVAAVDTARNLMFGATHAQQINVLCEKLESVEYENSKNDGGGSSLDDPETRALFRYHFANHPELVKEASVAIEECRVLQGPTNDAEQARSRPGELIHTITRPFSCAQKGDDAASAQQKRLTLQNLVDTAVDKGRREAADTVDDVYHELAQAPSEDLERGLGMEELRGAEDYVKAVLPHSLGLSDSFKSLLAKVRDAQTPEQSRTDARQALSNLVKNLVTEKRLVDNVGPEYQEAGTRERLRQSFTQSPSLREEIDGRLDRIDTLRNPSTAGPSAGRTGKEIEIVEAFDPTTLIHAELASLRRDLSDEAVAKVASQLPPGHGARLPEDWAGRLEWAMRSSSEVSSAIKGAPKEALEGLVEDTVRLVPQEYYRSSIADVLEFRSEASEMVGEVRNASSAISRAASWAASSLRKGVSKIPPYSTEELTNALLKGNVATKEPVMLMCLSLGSDGKISAHSTSNSAKLLFSALTRGYEKEIEQIIRGDAPEVITEGESEGLRGDASEASEGEIEQVHRGDALEVGEVESRQGLSRSAPKGIRNAPEVFLSIKKYDPKKLRENVYEPVIDLFRFEGAIDVMDSKRAQSGSDHQGAPAPVATKNVKVSSTNGMLLFKPLLTQGLKGLPENLSVVVENREIPLKEHLQNACPEIYEFESDNRELASFLNARKSDPRNLNLMTQLQMVPMMSQHYFESLDLEDSAKGIATSLAVGGGGGRIAEAALPPKEGGIVETFKSGTFWANMLMVQPLVDGIDNWGGEQSALSATLGRKGLKDTPETRYGMEQAPEDGRVGWDRFFTTRPTNLPADEWRRSLMLLMGREAKGPVAKDVRNTMSAAIQGAALGTVASTFSILAISNPHSPFWQGMIGTALSTPGTALSIPLLYREQLRDTILGTAHMIQEGRIKLPEGVDRNDPAAVGEYAMKAAMEYSRLELDSSMGLNTRLKAFALAPFISTLWLMAPAGVPRKVVDAAVQGTSSSAENLMSTAFLIHETASGYPNKLKKLEKMILESALAGKEGIDEKDLDHLLSDPLSRGVGNLLSRTVGVDKPAPNVAEV